MAKPVVVYPEAKAESNEAYAWYAERSEAAAERFANAVVAAYDRIAVSPAAYPQYPYGPGRFTAVKGYPYIVIFKENDDEIAVLAVAHGGRRPGYWNRT